MNIKLIKFGNDDFYKSLKHSLAFNEDDNSEIQAVVNRIIKDIKNNGDSALLSYTKKFDHLESKSLSELELTQESLKEAYESLDHPIQTARMNLLKELEIIIKIRYKALGIMLKKMEQG